MTFFSDCLIAWRTPAPDGGLPKLQHDAAHAAAGAAVTAILSWFGLDLWTTALWVLCAGAILEVVSILFWRENPANSVKDVCTYWMFFPFVLWYFGLWIFAGLMFAGLLFIYFKLLLKGW